MTTKDIDRQIAEKVMGWKFTIADGKEYISIKSPNHIAEGLFDTKDFTPSTNIAHAWQVVEKITGVEDKEVYFEVCRYSNGACATFIGYLNQGYSVSIEANTAPLAICKAALKVVEGR